ncbi:MAG: hypothetical protein R3F14_21185 [Polyangiaceae bacterium]
MSSVTQGSLMVWSWPGRTSTWASCCAPRVTVTVEVLSVGLAATTANSKPVKSWELALMVGQYSQPM